MIIEIVLQIVLLLIIGAIIKDIKMGIAIYIAYSFLVPYCKLGFGGFVLQQNLINTIVLLMVWLRTCKLDLKPFYAFVVFYVLILFSIPFTDGVSFSFQMDRWRSALMINLFVPIALWNMKGINNAYGTTRNCLLFVIIISCIYGLILTTMRGLNPYAMIFYMISGSEYRLEWFGTDTRLFGRISSVFVHPMQFGMFLGCSFIYIYSLRAKKSPMFVYIVLALLFANMIICGIRSVLFAFAITTLFFFLACKKFKIVLSIFCVVSLMVLIVYLVPELYDYFVKLSDISDRSTISGSNLNMRINQLHGCFREIHNCLYLGKGHMWHDYYLVNKGIHPEILGFESLLFIILCDYGYFGFIIYGSMVLVLLFTQNIYINNRVDRLVLTCYIVFYFSYCLLTGDYSYMKIWLIFYFLTFSEMYVSQGNSVIKLRIKELLRRKKNL